MTTALFINGVFESVLLDALQAQRHLGAKEVFLQPFKGQSIAMLRKSPPNRSHPVRLYVSTSKNLGQIRYTAQIVKWEDKRELSSVRRKQVVGQLKKYQAEGELELFNGKGKTPQKAVNLITITNLIPLETLHATSILRKVSDGAPLKKRTQPGGWSPVFDIGDLIDVEIETIDQYESDLRKAIIASSQLTDSQLKKRLAIAPEIPSKIQLKSMGYRRNPDVIIAVLRRAKGICECCGKPAPFLRKSDGSPYLEVHHWEPLSQGGKDIVENAGALCPNCHRQEHHG